MPGRLSAVVEGPRRDTAAGVKQMVRVKVDSGTAGRPAAIYENSRSRRAAEHARRSPGHTRRCLFIERHSDSAPSAVVNRSFAHRQTIYRARCGRCGVVAIFVCFGGRRLLAFT